LGVVGLGLALSVVSSGTSTVVGTAPVAAASCRGDSCDGLWPNEAGCLSDRRAVVQQSINKLPEFPDRNEEGTFIGTGRIYYSRTCRATWAEFSFTEWNEVAGAARPILQFWRQPQYGGRRQKVTGVSPDDPTRRIEFHRLPDTRTYRSPMSSGQSSVQMCNWHQYPGDSPVDPDLYPELVSSDPFDSCTLWI
jgi:hypothetical protein